jgi:hypothetical protein
MQLITHGNKEDVVFQLEGQGDGGSNQTKMKVCALFLYSPPCALVA